MYSLRVALMGASLAACGDRTVAGGNAGVVDASAEEAGGPDAPDVASLDDASVASPIVQATGSFGGFFVRFDDGRLFCRPWPYVGFEPICDLALRGTSGAWLALDLPPVQQVAVASWHACAVLRDGTVRCWGRLSHEGLAVEVTAPAEVSGLTDAVAVTLREGGACALDRGGAVWCWGLDPLGAGTPPFSDRPLRVNLPQAASFLGGGSVRACAGLRDGQVWCWGRFGESRRVSRGPTRDPTFDAYTGVDVGSAAECGLNPDRSVSCRGSLDGVPLERWAAITGPTTPLRTVSVGQYSACGVTTEATVDCWGYNGTGMLGARGVRGVNVRVGELHDVARVFVFDRGACALRRTGALVCWGDAIDTTGISPPHEVELPR